MVSNFKLDKHKVRVTGSMVFRGVTVKNVPYIEERDGTFESDVIMDYRVSANANSIANYAKKNNMKEICYYVGRKRNENQFN